MRKPNKTMPGMELETPAPPSCNNAENMVALTFYGTPPPAEAT
ncbi:MAG: hypothetical protein ACOYJK_06565 [Prevotella sp.]|jgi:hypothetical protein